MDEIHFEGNLTYLVTRLQFLYNFLVSLIWIQHLLLRGIKEDLNT